MNEHKLLPQFPASVRELFERHALEETPKKDDAAFARSRWWKILSNETAERAAAAAAARQGFAVEIDHSCDDWDYAAQPTSSGAATKAEQEVARACIISGGEVTVKVPANAGAGGRNQHFALYCAQKIAGENIAVLSAGTDGIDGNSPAAGAVADGTTMERARARWMLSPTSTASIHIRCFKNLATRLRLVQRETMCGSADHDGYDVSIPSASE